MIYLLYILHVIVSLFLILVVLLQQGKGADLSVFGGGGTMTAFGARGAATVLHKMTVISFVLFILTTLSIGVLQGNQADSTVMSGVVSEEAIDDTAAAETEEPAPEPAAAFPTEEAADTPAEGGVGAEASPATDSGDEATTGAPAEAPDDPSADAEDGAAGG